MIAVINTTDIANYMRTAMEENIKHMKKIIKDPAMQKNTVARVRAVFKAGIEQVEKCESNEDIQTLIHLGFVNFSVLQLDFQAVNMILQDHGIDIEKLNNELLNQDSTEKAS